MSQVVAYFFLKHLLLLAQCCIAVLFCKASTGTGSPDSHFDHAEKCVRSSTSM